MFFILASKDLDVFLFVSLFNCIDWSEFRRPPPEGADASAGRLSNNKTTEKKQCAQAASSVGFGSGLGSGFRQDVGGPASGTGEVPSAVKHPDDLRRAPAGKPEQINVWYIRLLLGKSMHETTLSRLQSKRKTATEYKQKKINLDRKLRL